MHKISLLAVDLDGTLLTDNKRLAPKGASLLKEASDKGIRVIISTTRNLPSVREYASLLDIFEPVICTNGAQIYSSPAGVCWYEKKIPLSAAKTFARLADSNGWELSTTIGEMTYWRKRPGMGLGRLTEFRTVVKDNIDAMTADPLRILVTDPEAIRSLHKVCQEKYSETCRADIYENPDGSLHAMGIFHRDTSKGSALETVSSRLGIPVEETLAIGDNYNDISMLTRAGIGVSMGNAPIKIKRIADYVAPTNEEEGVAWAVEKFI
ncbi:MAG: Cof-type HAD-IIB family hydrolase [Halanaerobium sp.]|nr:Cof-type HAD-IIB family hydrolase [Halanaerobium sp.]